ncbi:MAG: site-specific integrase [Anaerolineales bacterium]|nr:site-specific integrase [Chloroflexota bacterium]MBL6983264.1 site-specific integrase [Anaerolineales bacterium]
MADPKTAHISAQTTLIPAINGWEIFLNDQGSSPHTVKAFMGDIGLLASYLPPDRTLGSVTTSDLNNFLKWLTEERGVPCSPKTLARRITSIKAFFRWLHGAGVLLVDPAEKVVQKSVRSPLPKVLTRAEVEAVYEIAGSYRRSEKPDTRYFALLDLLLATGIKKSECLSLSPNHINLEADAEGGPMLFVRYNNPKHRYKERKIALPDSWVEAYEDYSAEHKLTDQLFPWSQRRLEYLLEDLSKEAGLEKHLSFSMCRWTCALIDWQSGMEPEKIRQKLGISKVQWREVSQKLRRLAANTEAD